MSYMEPINCILFDIGGVLVPDCSTDIECAMGSFCKLSRSEYGELMDTHRPEILTGRMTLHQFYDKLVNFHDLPANPDALVNQHLKLYRQTSMDRDSIILNLLNALKGTHLTACLTNTEPEIALLNRDAGLYDLYGRAFLSTELQLYKPQPEIFYQICDDLELEPCNILFIDDRLVNVLTALNIGMAAIHFHQPRQLLEELRRSEVLPPELADDVSNRQVPNRPPSRQ